MAASREAKLSAQADPLGLRLERSEAGYRLVDVNGTLVAADWTAGDGFGLTLDDVETALASITQ